MADTLCPLFEMLNVQDDPRGRSARHTDMIRRTVIDVLIQHAPRIAWLEPGAPWDEATEDAVRSALLSALKSPQDRDAASNHVSHVLRIGNKRGCWSHEPWPRKALSAPAPSTLRRRDASLIAAADARQAALHRALPELLRHPDPDVVAGALLVSAADHSALLNKQLLSQLLGNVAQRLRYGQVAFVDLPLGKPGSPLRTVRRWFPDPASEALMQHLLDLGPEKMPDADRALRRLTAVMDWPAIDLKGLAASARARWATRLPSLLLTIAHQPLVAPSLPATALQRLATGLPLAPHQNPIPVRAAAAAAARQAVAELRGEIESPLTVSARLAKRAVNQLAYQLGPQNRGVEPDSEMIQKRLDKWKAGYGTLGGWVSLLGLWLQEALFHNGREARAADELAGPAGLKRYLEGFGTRFIAAFHDLPPHAAMADPDAFAERIEQVVLSFAGLASKGPPRAGLKQFLEFIHRNGGPRVVFDSRWRVDVRESEADANVLTPIEYVRTLELHGAPGEGFTTDRLRVMTILAYRLGTRWRELASLRFMDMQLTREAPPRGAVWIRPNPYSHGKTPEAERKLAVEQFLTPGERQELGDFLALARSILGKDRPATDCVFADTTDPATPPRKADTHDVIQSAMRLVSGDGSLVFHHLRHSMATALFCRIFLEERPADLDWMPGLDVVEGAALGFPQGETMRAMTGRDPRDPSRLYVISKALGHLDPTSSMRSYIHMGDWLLACRTRRYFELPTDVAAAIGGIKRASVRRQKHRERKR